MQSLSQVAYDHIRNMLARGAFGSAGELSEPGLALELGISRTPVREAIRQLASEGLLEQRPRRGTFVCQPSRRDLEEIYQVRLLLEPFAAAQAARLIDRAGLQELQEALEAMQALTRKCKSALDKGCAERLLPEYAGHDLAFHRALLGASANNRICKVVADARVLTQAVAYPQDSPAGALPSMVRADREHARIFQSVKRRDAAAAEDAMRFHLSRGRDSVLEYWDWLERRRSDVPA